MSLSIDHQNPQTVVVLAQGWIDANITKEQLYRPPVEVGKVMDSFAVVKVLDVGKGVKGDWKVGQLAVGDAGWTEYAVMKENTLRPAPCVFGRSSRYDD